MLYSKGEKCAVLFANTNTRIAEQAGVSKWEILPLIVLSSVTSTEVSTIAARAVNWIHTNTNFSNPQRVHSRILLLGF